MNRDDAQKAAAWAAKHDAALGHWQDRIRRRDQIVVSFRDHKPASCTLDVKFEKLNNRGYYDTFNLSFPSYIARDLMLTDIARQITIARIAALKAGVDAALLVDPGPPQGKKP